MKRFEVKVTLTLFLVFLIVMFCFIPSQVNASGYNNKIWFEEGDELTLVGIDDEAMLTISGADYDFTSVEWRSKDGNIVSVDENGNILAVGAGSTYVYATAIIEEDDAEIASSSTASPSVASIRTASSNEATPSVPHKTATARCKVTVEVPVTGFNISTSDFTLEYKNATKLLEYNIEPGNASNTKIHWSSNNEAVAKVDSKGKVTAISEGEAIIAGKTDDGSFNDSCIVTVDFSQKDPNNDNYDILAPSIDNIKVLTPEIGAPGIVKVKVDVTEEGAGLTELRIGVSPSNSQSIRDDCYGYGYYTPGSSYTGSYEIDIPISNKNAPVGEWIVTFVYAEDGQGNISTNYDGAQVIFNVISSNRTDLVAPQISNIEVLTPEVKIPGTVKFKVSIKEEDSGVKEMRFKISHKILGNGVSGNDHQFGYYYFNPKDTKSGDYIVETYLSNPLAASGEWTISWVYIMDDQGNLSYDYRGTPVSFIVDNPQRNDFTKPELTAIHITPEDIVAPGIVKISLDIKEEESGMAEISLCLRNDVTRKEIYYHIDTNQNGGKTGIYSQILPMNMYTNAGSWGVEWLSLTDKQGNYKSYGWAVGDTPEDVDGNATFHVSNDLAIQLQTSLNNPRLPELLENMPENGVALLNPDTNIVNTDTFEAIEGTNKSIVINNDGIQWVFNGKDINSSDIKPINIQTDLRIVSGIDYGFDEQVMQIIFRDNGILPGIAKIRLKSDYLYAKYNAQGNLILSWLNSNGLQVEDNDVLCNEDTYTEFYVSHNSTFIVSSQDQDEKLVAIDVAPPQKTVYKKGEPLDLSGLYVYGVYESSNRRQLSNYEISQFDNNKLGEQQIFVTYGNRSVAFSVTVKENSDPGTDVQPDNPTHGNTSSGGSSGGGGGGSSSGMKSGTTSSAQNTPGAWKQDEHGWWFQKQDGSYPKDEWIMIKNVWYRFDLNGYMQTGWIGLDKVKYFLNQNGSMVSNDWALENEKWYFFNESGAMQTGWVNWKDKWYYMNPDGSMAVNITTPDGYKIDSNGVWVE